MKKIVYFIVSTFLLLHFSACQDDFLEKPSGSDVTVDSIFSTEQKAMKAIAQAYSYSLSAGIPMSGWNGDKAYGMSSGTLSHLSGEINSIKFNWEDSWLIQHSGMTADAGSGQVRSDDGFTLNYIAIRQCYLVIENIDKAGDMTIDEKNIVKAEMKTLIAYRYEEMFKRYGGVPIVTSTLSYKDDVNIPRSTLKDLLDHIVSLCDEAISTLPNAWPDKDNGRVTKGVAMAIKAETYMYAARPLFNSAVPYMDLGENNNLICFETYDKNLWKKAIDASIDVINWAEQNGYEIINTGKPLDDYGTAVSTPGNNEIILAYKNQHNGGITYYSPRAQSGGANSMSYNMLEQYYKEDGTDQVWPTVAAGKVNFSDFTTRIQQMEPRYKASAMAAGIDAWNNPNDYNWSCRVMADYSTWEGRQNNEDCGRRVKFWYKAGNRNWFEFPIYRLAEFYLDVAEAYNEYDDPVNALEYLKVIRNRAGLPEIAETDKAKLRKIIQREWAIEFYEEGHRFFDVKHWKLEDVGNGIIGGPKLGFVYTYNTGTFGYYASDYLTYSLQVRYTGFWSNSQYLTPFPITEVNKGYITQNPGY